MGTELACISTLPIQAISSSNQPVLYKSRSSYLEEDIKAFSSLPNFTTSGPFPNSNAMSIGEHSLNEGRWASGAHMQHRMHSHLSWNRHLDDTQCEHPVVNLFNYGFVHFIHVYRLQFGRGVVLYRATSCDKRLTNGIIIIHNNLWSRWEEHIVAGHR